MALAISMTDNKKSTYTASTNSIHLIEKQDAQVHKYKHRIAKFLKEVSSWPRLLLKSVCVLDGDWSSEWPRYPLWDALVIGRLQ